MANYTGIQGQNILIVSSDPANPTEGQIWYNSTSQTLKGQKLLAGAWATGGNLNTARRYPAGAGNKTAALAFGGETPPQTAITESYNGISWTEVNDLNTPRQELAGTGTQTSAIGFGGRQPTISSASESWNGTSWTNTPSLNTARRFLSSAGANNTSALGFGGIIAAPGGAATGNTESWNGSSWTEVNDLNTARGFLGGGGTNTVAIQEQQNLGMELLGLTHLH
jgi:hypothetical protein